MNLPSIPPPDPEWTPFRRIHERPEDVDNENIVRRMIERRTGWSLIYLPDRKFKQIRFKMTGVDPNVIEARADVKCRSIVYNQFPTYKTASWKWDLAARYFRSTGVNTYFFVWFDNGAYFIKYDSRYSFCRVTWGRTAERDPFDANSSIEIPMVSLARLEDWPHEIGPVL
jgi:hypothetical protein